MRQAVTPTRVREISLWLQRLPFSQSFRPTGRASRYVINIYASSLHRSTFLKLSDRPGGECSGQVHGFYHHFFSIISLQKTIFFKCPVIRWFVWWWKWKGNSETSLISSLDGEERFFRTISVINAGFCCGYPARFNLVPPMTSSAQRNIHLTFTRPPWCCGNQSMGTNISFLFSIRVFQHQSLLKPV